MSVGPLACARPTVVRTASSSVSPAQAHRRGQRGLPAPSGPLSAQTALRDHGESSRRHGVTLAPAVGEMMAPWSRGRGSRFPGTLPAGDGTPAFGTFESSYLGAGG